MATAYPVQAPTPAQLGFISYLPTPWIPYAELIRMQDLGGIPRGCVATVLGILYALDIVDLDSRLPLPILTSRITRLLVASYFIRSAGCAWNDIIDQDFDRQTARCRNRPVARGAVSTRNGIILTLVCTYLAYFPIADFSAGSLRDAAGMAFFAGLYPFGKRFTHLTQVILGVTFSMGFLAAAEGLGARIFDGEYVFATGGLVGVIVMLFVFFDVVYARQDTEDDLKSGVKSMAVLFRGCIPELLSVVTLLTGACLVVTGYVVGFGMAYYVLAVGGVVGSYTVKISLLGRPGVKSGWCLPLAILGLMGGLYWG